MLVFALASLIFLSGQGYADVARKAHHRPHGARRPVSPRWRGSLRWRAHALDDPAPVDPDPDSDYCWYVDDECNGYWVPCETGTDSGTSAGTNSGTDSGTSAGTNSGTDAGTDSGTDSGTDGGTDGGNPDPNPNPNPNPDPNPDPNPVVSLELIGPVGNGTPKSPYTLAVGQFLNATIKNLPSDAVVTWSKPSAGAPFQNYDASNASAKYTPFTVPPTWIGSLLCYFAQPAASVRITCRVQSASRGMNTPFTKYLKVEAPKVEKARDYTTAIGAMTLRNRGDGGDPISYLLDNGIWTLDGASFFYGVRAEYTVTDPEFLKDPGSGLFGCVQTLVRNSSTTVNVGTPNENTKLDSATGLDKPGGNGFPYPNLTVTGGQASLKSVWVPADGRTPFNFMDAPGFPSYPGGTFPARPKGAGTAPTTPT